MPKPVFLKYFTQSDTARAQAGFKIIDGKLKNEAERLRDILVSKKILGGNQKGYFRYKYDLPSSISLTGRALEELDDFFVKRSFFGLSFLTSGVPKAKPVIYLDEYTIKSGAFNPKDIWLVDLVRTPEECYTNYEEIDDPQEQILDYPEKKPYDYRWQEEWRIQGSALNFNRIDFVFAPGEAKCKRVREFYGQEAYDTIDHTLRVNDYRQTHNGRNPPLERILGRIFTERNEDIKKAKPKEGKVILPEIVELAWDEIRKI